jgi:hypothetical protein
MQKWMIRFWLWMFAYSSNKLFQLVVIFANDSDNVLVIHCARDELSLIRSMNDYLMSVKEDENTDESQ